MHKISLLLLTISLFTSPLSAQINAQLGGGGHNFTHTNCLTETERDNIKTQLRQDIAELERAGKILPPTEQAVALDWVLRRKSSVTYNDYYLINNFVDQDATTGIKDFNCGTKTYNGHKGTDISPYPFSYHLMNNDLIEIVAGAAGVIINKIDGNFDKNCTCTGTWNAVYIRHDDGSVAWYGHMKKNSQTTKAVGTRVEKGEFLGIVGSSGCSTGPHLHLEIYANAAQTTLVEPSAGTCNAQSNGTTSWWANQKPHKEPTVNAALTHSAPPELYFDCPSDRDKMNLKTAFRLLDTVWVAGYFRDQTIGQSAVFRVRNPSGAILNVGTSNFTQNYNASWWWYRFVISNSFPLGTWKFEIVHNDQTAVQEFTIGTATSTKDIDNQQISIYPNPAADVLMIENVSHLPKDVRLFNSIGQNVARFQNVENSISLAGLPSGFYTIEIKFEGRLAIKSFVRK